MGRLPAGLAALFLGGLLLAGCTEEGLSPLEPEGQGMFRTYVALGNSITAGFQSGGINDSTQRASYANTVADAMDTRFNLPLLAAPGCPPPLAVVFTGERVGGGSADTCAGRETPPPRVLHNVAVPGAAVIDPLSNLDPASSPNPLTSLILGGRTQLEAAREADPTFVSVWLGNNDLLDAALSGSTQEITPPPAFVGRYASVAGELVELDLEGAVLVGVADVTLVPHLSPAAAYFRAAQQGRLPPAFSVDDSCAPDDLGRVTLVPFGYGFGVLVSRAVGGEAVELDCVADPRLLQPTELKQLKTIVQIYNMVIQEIAEEQGWAFVNPNPVLEELRREGRIPPFPNTTGQAAVEHPFGELFSKDGIHPAAPLHRRMAELVVKAINEEYGTGLTPPGP